MILVFAGAGASKAAGEERYPTTAEFFRLLPDKITTNPLFRQIVQYHQRQSPDRTIDIELILWSLADLIAAAHGAHEPTTPLGHLLEDNRIHHVLPGTGDMRGAIATFAAVIRLAEQLRDDIHGEIYTHYAPEPPEGLLKDAWLPLLQGALKVPSQLKERPTHVYAFTTNYDCVIEHAIEAGGLPLETGRTRLVYDRLDPSWWAGAWKDRYNRVEADGKRGLLTKLHGSVDWTEDAGTIYVGTPTFRGEHDQRVILYPGFKGEPATDPFRSFHRHLSDCLQDAEALVFVGFAFRDAHINTILQRETRTTARLIVVDPNASLQAVPYADRSGLVHIKEPFAKPAVDQVLGALPPTA